MTEKEKDKLKQEEREERRKAKKNKRKRSVIHQGLLDLMNISDPAVSGDNTKLRSLANNKQNSNVKVLDPFSKCVILA